MYYIKVPKIIWSHKTDWQIIKHTRKRLVVYQGNPGLQLLPTKYRKISCAGKIDAE